MVDIDPVVASLIVSVIALVLLTTSLVLSMFTLRDKTSPTGSKFADELSIR